MPELPEVEWFRRVLLPLVDEEGRNPPLAFKLLGENPPRKWVAAEDVDAHTEKWRCTDVLRKGKQLCMVLERDTNISGRDKKITKKDKTESKDKEVCYFYLHMGMTGRLVSPTKFCTWGHKYVSDSPDAGEEEGDDKLWPPRFTYLVLSSGDTMVAFADPRKFGACYFEFGNGGHDGGTGGGSRSVSSPTLSPSLFGDLAPDALADTSTPEQRSEMAANLSGQRLGVKALILDQKRVVSGVGNWVADEVLYGCELHPDQSYLTEEQALAVVETLQSVVSIAVDCLNKGVPYPDEWLFGYRWTKKKAGKDFLGRNLTFVTSGGRTSAIVASLQKLRKSQKKAAAAAAAGKPKAKKGRGAKATKSSSSEVEAETATTVNEEKEEEKPALPRKRKVAGSKTVLDGRGGKRKKTDPSSSTGVIAAAESNTRRRSGGSRNTNGSDDSTNADPAPDAVLPRSPTSEDHTNAANNKQQNEKKKTVEKESQADDGESAEELFRRKKEATLKGVDQSVKDDFRRIGFAKWQKDWLPIIQLGPYDVEDGPVRHQWMKLFRKNSKKTKKPKSTHKRLVYWYGSNRDNLSSSFSFVNACSVIGYEEGLERGVCDGLSSKIQQKMERNARLTAKEKLLVEGMKEVKDEFALSKEERVAWLSVEESHTR